MFFEKGRRAVDEFNIIGEVGCFKAKLRGNQIVDQVLGNVTFFGQISYGDTLNKFKQGFRSCQAEVVA